MKVLDLFCGMGGLSFGFSRTGFQVIGADTNPHAGQTFERNRVGRFVRKDLSQNLLFEEADIILGGPPCQPWSPLNAGGKRGSRHTQYGLVEVFFRHVQEIRPRIFVLENVPPLRRDSVLESWMETLKKDGYALLPKTVKYSDFGAPTARKRFFLFGFLREKDAMRFRTLLEEKKRQPVNAWKVLHPYADLERGSFPDHVWPELRTIDRYREKYRTGKFGWCRISMERPAPSFGNIMKTYVLHPLHDRVISVREAMALMGFPNDFVFPEEVPMSARYQMVVNAVSPVFSRVIAEVLLSGFGEGISGEVKHFEEVNHEKCI